MEGRMLEWNGEKGIIDQFLCRYVRAVDFVIVESSSN